MSWEDYLALGEDVHGEYIDGKLIVTPRGTFLHQRVTQQLVRALSDTGFIAVQEWAWRPDGTRQEYQPDVMVLSELPADDANWTALTPVLAAEVTSPSNADKDWSRNMRDYAGHGLPAYWILDHGDRSLHAFELREGKYVEVAHGTGLVRVPGWWGEMGIDVAALWSSQPYGTGLGRSAT